MPMRKPRDIADLVREAIDKGATTVEEIHKSIANLPLKILEEIKILKKPIKEVRRVQDRSIGAVYDLIREINKRVGRLASDRLRRGTPTVPARKAPAASARASHRKT
jgi:hypothetical protein